MAKSYSTDLREKALAQVDAGETISKVAEIFGIGIATLHRWIKRRKETGSCKAIKGYQKGHTHKIDLEKFKEMVDKNPGMTLKETAKELGNVCVATVRRAMKKIGYTHKKKR